MTRQCSSILVHSCVHNTPLRGDRNRRPSHDATTCSYWLSLTRTTNKLTQSAPQSCNQVVWVAGSSVVMEIKPHDNNSPTGKEVFAYTTAKNATIVVI